MHSHAPPIIDELFNQLAFPFALISSKTLVYRTQFPFRKRSLPSHTTELYYITGGPARQKKVKPKTWRISSFADAISMTTGPYVFLMVITTDQARK